MKNDLKNFNQFITENKTVKIESPLISALRIALRECHIPKSIKDKFDISINDDGKLIFTPKK